MSDQPLWDVAAYPNHSSATPEVLDAANCMHEVGVGADKHCIIVIACCSVINQIGYEQCVNSFLLNVTVRRGNAVAKHGPNFVGKLRTVT